MNTISSAITRRFHDLQNNPRHANVLGEELSRSFLFNVRRSAQNQRDRSGRSARRSSAADLRISSSFKAQITCLQDPCVTRINTNLHLDSLTSVGLGMYYGYINITLVETVYSQNNKKRICTIFHFIGDIRNWQVKCLHDIYEFSVNIVTLFRCWFIFHCNALIIKVLKVCTI